MHMRTDARTHARYVDWKTLYDSTWSGGKDAGRRSVLFRNVTLSFLMSHTHTRTHTHNTDVLCVFNVFFFSFSLFFPVSSFSVFFSFLFWPLITIL